MGDKVNEFTFVWKIWNFSMLPHRNGESLSSSLFEVYLYKDAKFRVSLFPRGAEGKEEYAACFLHRTESNFDLQVKFHFVLQSTETTDAIVSDKVVYPKHVSGYGFHDLFNLNEIYAKKHLYLPNDILTLRCHFLPLDEACVESIANELDSEGAFNMKITSLVCRSGIQVRRRSVIWSIRKIKNKFGEVVEKIVTSALSKSPSFKLSIKFDEIATKQFASITIRQIDNSLENGTFVKCKLTVISANKEHQDSHESTHFFPIKPDVWQFPPFIKASNLTPDKYLFPDDTLYLQCEFAFTYENEEVCNLEDICMPLTIETRPNDTMNELSTSIGKCYSSGKLCDIQLQAGDRIFPAHKLVLGARSPVFSAMFENDMKEKNSGVVDIVDVDPTTLRRMLFYLYDEVLSEDLSSEGACKLYEAADKYDIPSLKHRCRVPLISCLSVASVCDVLVLADAHQDSFLLTAVYNFICSHDGEIFLSSYWRSLMDNEVELAAEVMLKMLTEKKRL